MIFVQQNKFIKYKIANKVYNGSLSAQADSVENQQSTCPYLGVTITTQNVIYWPVTSNIPTKKNTQIELLRPFFLVRS